MAGAHGQPQTQAALALGQPECGGLERAHLQAAELARSAERDVLPGFRLAIDARAVQAERPLGGLGVARNLERKLAEGAGAAQMRRPDQRPAGAVKGRSAGGEVDRRRGRSGIDDPDRSGDVAGGEDRAGTDGQLQVGAGRGQVSKRQGARRLDPTRVGVDARQVDSARDEAERGRGAGWAIVALPGGPDRSIQARGRLDEGQVHMGGFHGQVGNVESGEVCGEVGSRSPQ